MNGSGCKTCAVYPNCTAKYRGSACKAIRDEFGLGDPMTNADHIRSMTDEELAEFLRWDICSKVRGDNRMCNGWCDECVIDWLKQPYKSEETDKKEKEEL